MAAEALTCPSCRRSISPGSKHCSNCGYIFPVRTEELAAEAWALEAGYIPGLAIGAAVTVSIESDSIDVSGPNGRALRVPINDASLERDVLGLVRLRSRPDAVDITLRPTGGEREAELAAVIVWSYPGRTQVDAGQAYARHATQLDAKGYVPIAQSWGEGRPGAGRVLMLGEFATAIRPKGFLTVTYRRKEVPKESMEAAPVDPIDQIRRLGELRDAGLITPAEFDAKKAELLSRM